ncbi:hypothetical protein PUG81_27435 [Erwiniaceae bacterium L1_54_6]|nr:hypothetical protein [Erwiniaceae bacterium L1_54_6]
MKVKEKLGDGRGRPRKYVQGEMQYRKLWLPENLLMELRGAARVRGYTTNDEVISRLVSSLRFTPRRPVIKTDEGQQMVALARLFDEFLQSQLDIICRDMEISARFNQRSVNQEIMERLLDSLNYFTEQQLPENEEVRRLRELAILFDEFIAEKVAVAENPLTNNTGEEKKEKQ